MIDEIYNIAERFAENSDENNVGIYAIPKNATVAMAYVPYQKDDSMYSKEQGLMCGTMFKVLNKPFKGIGVKRND